MGASRGGTGGRDHPPPPGKSQVVICSLRNTGTDSLDKQLDQKCPIASRGRFVRTSVKYVVD